MRVTLLLHGVLRQLAGSDSIGIELPAGASAQAALDQLAQLVPRSATRLQHTACAIGDTLVSRKHALRNGETLALIPPVSGG